MFIEFWWDKGEKIHHINDSVSLANYLNVRTHIVQSRLIQRELFWISIVINDVQNIAIQTNSDVPEILENSLKKFTEHILKNLPNVVVKCSWATNVFAHRWFLISQARNVLSSEQLNRYLPPGWNCKSRTQLSWPTWCESRIIKEWKTMYINKNNSTIWIITSGFFASLSRLPFH